LWPFESLNAPLVRCRDLYQIADQIRVPAKDSAVLGNILIVLLDGLGQTLHVCR
jgi:hypothetical protein